MNLYIVESPLQLLCAYESLSENKEPYKLVIRMTGRGDNDKHLLYCAKFLGVKYQKLVIRTEKVKYDFLINIFKILCLCLKKYKIIFFGSYYSNLLKILKKILKSDEVYYLDDGLATLRAQEEILKKSGNVNWYTFFDFEGSSEQNIRKHNFFHLKKLSKQKIRKGVFFIGQPVEHMINFEKNTYISFIEKIVKAYGKLYYIPHRVEDVKDIEEIQNIEVLKLDYPIELFFLFYSDIIPCKIFSYYSTALITCNILLDGVNCNAIKINNDLNNIYHCMYMSGVKVVDISSIDGGIECR